MLAVAASVLGRVATKKAVVQFAKEVGREVGKNIAVDAATRAIESGAADKFVRSATQSQTPLMKRLLSVCWNTPGLLNGALR